MKKLQLFLMAAIMTAMFSLPSLASIYYGNYTTIMGTNTFGGKVFISDDGKMKANANEYVMITRGDKKVSWTLMPSQNTYSERAVSAQGSASVSLKIAGEISREKVGSELVNNVNCEKYKVECKAGKKKVSIYQWISADYAFPLKAATVDGKWSMELSDIQATTQLDSIFDIPDGFKKI